MPLHLALALAAGMALLTPSASFASGCVKFEAPPLLDQLFLRTGGRYIPIPEALGPRPKNRSVLIDLAMPASGVHISVRDFPASLSAFLPFDKTGEGLLGKRETMYAWVVLMASWQLGVAPDPNALYIHNEAGKLVPVSTFFLCRDERRYLSAVAEHNAQGRAAKVAMRIFMMNRIADGDGPVYIDGQRLGGMDSGNNNNNN